MPKPDVCCAHSGAASAGGRGFDGRTDTAAARAAAATGSGALAGTNALLKEVRARACWYRSTTSRFSMRSATPRPAAKIAAFIVLIDGTGGGGGAPPPSISTPRAAAAPRGIDGGAALARTIGGAATRPAAVVNVNAGAAWSARHARSASSSEL